MRYTFCIAAAAVLSAAMAAPTYATYPGLDIYAREAKEAATNAEPMDLDKRSQAATNAEPMGP